MDPQPNWSNISTNVVSAVIAVSLVIGAVYESVVKGQVDPALLALVTAVVATYFTGAAVRQVNGTKVEGLTRSVDSLHARFDSANVANVPVTPRDETKG